MFPIQTAISWGYTPWNQGVYIYIYTRMYKRQQKYNKKKNMDIRYLHIFDMVTLVPRWNPCNLYQMMVQSPLQSQ